MRSIHVAIELSSEAFSLVILEKIKRSFYVLYADFCEAKGIENEIVTNTELAIKTVREMVEKARYKTSLNINSVIVSLLPVEARFNVVQEKISVDSYDQKIGSYEINTLMAKCANKNVSIKEEVIMLNPVRYSVDGLEVDNPLDMDANSLEIKAISAIMQRKYLYPYFNIFNGAGLEIKNICLSPVGMYKCFENSHIKFKHGILVDVRSDTTNINVFNKGLIIKSHTINIGYNSLIRELSVHYNIDYETAYKLINKFVSLSMQKTDRFDKIELSTINQGIIKISQEDISNVVGEKLYMIMKKIKKELEVLTNRKIDYIIIVGILSKIKSLNKFLEDIFNTEIILEHKSLIGARDYRYNSIIGSIYQTVEKDNNKGIENTMFSEIEIEGLMRNINLLKEEEHV